MNWLLASQHPDGSWPDFIVSPTTEGREWTTGYIGAQLSDLAQCRRGVGRALLERSWVFLRESRRSEGGWGFWAGSPVDADSTSWCLLSLLATQPPFAETFDEERALLRGHLAGESSGCATYRRLNLSNYPDDSGYFSPTPCVSAVVGRALLRLCNPADRDVLTGIHTYLLSTQRADGSWPSFWWERRIYSTAMALRFLLTQGHTAAEFAPVARWVESLQDADGSWHGERHPQPNAFLTVLAVSMLLDLGQDWRHGAARRGIDWLLDAQGLDGTWPCPPIMKIPRLEDPWQDDQESGGVIVQSHRGNFVTATVVGVLGRLAEPSTHACQRLPEIHLHDPALDREVEEVIRVFDAEVANLPERVLQIASAAPEWHRRGAGLSHYLPFWLDDSLTGGSLRTAAARPMAVANRYGQVFCLLQDGVLDEDVGTPVDILIPIDGLFLRFVRGYQQIFPANHRLWNYFDRYWHEYLEALAWERRRRSRRFGPEDHDWLGKKFSPVKICAAGFALLADREELITELERCLDALQAGFQMLDDLRDVPQDLDHDRSTWPLALVMDLCGGDLPAPNAVEDILWTEGPAHQVLARATACFDRAWAVSESIGLHGMSRWLQQLLEYVRHATAGLPEPGGSARSALRVFQDADRHVIFNSSSGLAFDVAPDVGAFARKLIRGGPPKDTDEAQMYEELMEAGVLSDDSTSCSSQSLPKTSHPSVLFLGAHAGCGHRCTCCPVWSAPDSVSSVQLEMERARQAVDLLVRADGLSEPRHLVFLDAGGAVPWRLIEHLIEMAPREAAKQGTSMRFHVVLGPGPLAIEVLQTLSASGGSVLLRRDGVESEAEMKPLFDRMDRLETAGIARVGVNLGLRDYSQSPARLLAELDRRGLFAIGIQSRRTKSGGTGVSRLDVEATQADFQALVDQFAIQAESGHCIALYDVLHPLWQVHERRRVTSPCGAARQSVAVQVGGELLPCFHLANRPALVVGDVKTGTYTERLQPYWRSVEDREPCQSCWARYLCGGGCHVGHLEKNGDIRRPDPDECRLITHRYRRILLLAARLGSHLRAVSRTMNADDFVTFQV